MYRIRSLSLAALLAALVLILAACSSGTPSATDTPSEAASEAPSQAASESATPSEDGGAEGATVRIDGSAFDPAELTVAVGTEVTWVNADAFGHTVTDGTDGQAVEDPIVDEPIDQNGSVSVAFDQPGTYEITCAIHPSMQMTVIVEG